MTTDVIDVSLHVSSFPSTYIGSGTLIGNCIQSGGDETDVHGYFTSDGNAVSIPCGFQPLEIDIFNMTDGKKCEWQLGMAATNTVLTTFTGPTVAVDTNSLITVTESDTGMKSEYTVLLASSLVGTSKLICFKIEG